jgi:hypothetical protein
MGSHLAKLLAQNHVLQAFEPSLVDSLLAIPTREVDDGLSLPSLFLFLFSTRIFILYIFYIEEIKYIYQWCPRPSSRTHLWNLVQKTRKSHWLI